MGYENWDWPEKYTAGLIFVIKWDRKNVTYIKIYFQCKTPIRIEELIQGISKRALQLWKRIEIYTEDIHNVLNCQNVAKHTEFYLG